MASRTMRAGAAAAALCTSVLTGAHHNIGMIDLAAPTWVKATVIRYDPRNPHVILVLEERPPDGPARSWTIEGPIMARLQRMNLGRDFIKPGDVIEVCGFPFRKDILAAHAAGPAGSPPLPHLHGMLLVLPDGTRQPWGPYGKLDNCVRPNDTPAMWREFVDSAPMAHEYWCKGLLFPGAAAAASKPLVAEVNRGLRTPCE